MLSLGRENKAHKKTSSAVYSIVNEEEVYCCASR